MKKTILETYKEFFDKLGVEYQDINIIEKEKNIFLVKLETEKSGVIIGQNGKNLDAINLITKLIISKKIEEKVRIYLEINDYLKLKDDNLKNLIISKVKIVEKNGKDLKLPFYNSYNRKKIHSFVGDYGNPKIYTKSIGEGRDRRLYICKKDEKLTIDMDSLEI